MPITAHIEMAEKQDWQRKTLAKVEKILPLCLLAFCESLEESVSNSYGRFSVYHQFITTAIV